MYAKFDLTGKVALVTGGNSGIGLGFAEGLAQAGADVCIWGTNEDKTERARAQLERHGTRIRALRCDVGDEAAVRAGFAKTLEELGRVDSCFANAGSRRGALRSRAWTWGSGVTSSASTWRACSSRSRKRFATWWRAAAAGRWW